MKLINLLRLKEEKNFRWKKFFLIWAIMLLLCTIFIFVEKILIIHKIKQYQLSRNNLLIQLKFTSEMLQKTKKLKYKEKILIKFTTVTAINHRQIIKFMDFLTYLRKIIKSDNIFIRLIEFNPPYCSVLLQTISEKKFLLLIKNLKLHYDPKLQWKILNKTPKLYLDFIIKVIFDENIEEKNLTKNEKI